MEIRGTSPPPSGAGAAGGDAEHPATEPGDQSVTDRRRASALAGHTGDADHARAALTDPHPSVRSTALGALERLGVLTDRHLRAAGADPDPSVRRRAVELAATHPGVGIAHALHDGDASVVEMGAWSAGERGDADVVETLAALASSTSGHPDPLCREAAVAALGAIGDATGLPAVIRALEDKPAVRRRAAVALAAFEGPEVDAALRRCLSDRDWQVRQVAEDLLSME